MFKYYSLITALVVSSLSIAENSSQHDHDHSSDKHSSSEQQAHLHGVAELTLAIEGNSVEINLESPSINIVGFEHKATSKQHIKAVDQAKAILESSSNLFFFSGTDCAIRQATIDMSALIEQEQDHHHHKHDDDHSEINASYLYQCSQGEKLDTVSVNLIALFPKLEQLKVMWLTNHQQGATTLTTASNLIRIR